MSNRVRLPHKVARELDRELRGMGFTLGFSGSGHIVWRRGEQVVRAPSSPGDWGNVRKQVLSNAQRGKEAK